MIDLSHELTVFLITTSGEPNFNDALSALESQTVKFKLEIIKDYSPLSKAFQEMLNRCTTPYYIECDSDMVLYSDTVEKMYNAIKQADEKRPFVCYRLKDVHLDFPLFGIKIYRTADFKKYPYNLEHPSCEVEQLDRMKLDGYIFDSLKDDIVGLHSPHWTESGIFERYYNLMEKFKLYHYVWLEKLPAKLFDIFQKNPTELNFYAIAGALKSIYSTDVMNEEKDSRKTRHEFKLLESYMHLPHQSTLYMTSRCNYQCDFCLRQYDGIKNVPDMTIEMVTKMLDKFPSIKATCICGFGETLLAEKLIDILKYLKTKKIFTGLITNGSLLKSKLDSLIGWYQPNYISVSLNAHLKEEHQRITKTDTYDDVIEGIKMLVNSPIEAYVSAVVSTENIDRIPDLIKFVHSLGVKKLHLHNILPHFDCKEFTNFWDLVLTEEHKQIIEQWKQIPEAVIVDKYPTLIDKNGGRQTCQFPQKMIGVDGAGNVSICNSVFPCSNEMFGNLSEYALWNSEKLNKFRMDFSNKKIEACQKCFRNWLYL